MWKGKYCMICAAKGLYFGDSLLFETRTERVDELKVLAQDLEADLDAQGQQARSLGKRSLAGNYAVWSWSSVQ